MGAGQGKCDTQTHTYISKILYNLKEKKLSLKEYF